MRKILIALLVLGLLVVGSYQVALAFGNGYGKKARHSEGSCWPGQNAAYGFCSLSPEIQQEIESIKEAYRDKLSALTEKVRELRQAGDTEGLQQALEEMQKIREEMRSKIEPLLPEECRELQQQIAAIREKYSERINAVKEEMRKIKEEMGAEIEPLLPEEYREKFADRNMRFFNKPAHRGFKFRGFEQQ